MQCEVWVQVGTERTVPNTFPDPRAEEVKTLVVDPPFERQKPFDRSVPRVHRIELRHETHLILLLGEILGHVMQQSGDPGQPSGRAFNAPLRIGCVFLHDLANDRPNDVVLVREILVKGGGAKVTGGDDLGHCGAIDTMLVEQLSGRVEDPAALPLAMQAIRPGQLGFGLFRHASSSRAKFGQPIRIRLSSPDHHSARIGGRQWV